MKNKLKKACLALALSCWAVLSFAQPNITKVEYYVDKDPGYGKATNISIPQGKDLSDISFNLDPSKFISGVHLVGVRARDANGAWSHDNKWLFLKPFSQLPNDDSVSLIAQVEYYIDADPGYGKGIPVAIPASKNLSDIQLSTNVTGLKAGKHAIFIRAKDGYGKWSHDNTDSFNIPSLLAAPAITVTSIAGKSAICARDSFDISYHATGTYNAGNKFNVELSDAAGSFTSATTIGSYTGTVNAIVKVKLPSHLPEGTGYKVRVNSTNPVLTGVASAAITLHDRPNAPSITGATDANNTFSYPYTVPAVTGSAWNWIAPAATITPTANTASLKWNIAGLPDSIQAIETSQYGCVGDTGLLKVNVYNLKIDNVISSSLTPCPSGTLTVSGNATGVYDAANKFTAQLSDASGSFNSPVNIGSVSANPVGISKAVSINATLPFPLVNGTGYRVRIISTSPSVTGGDNGKDIIVNKPDLGADQIVKKCTGFKADISSVFVTTGLAVDWNTATPSSVDVGVYMLIVTNTNGCKDTANVTVSDYPKPNLGEDKTVTVSCLGGTSDLTSVYDLTGLTAIYNAASPKVAQAGIYQIIVTNTNGCKDTANITVLDMSITPLATQPSITKMAERECTDASGWTHYYNNNGTPSDFSDDILLLSIKKEGNTIGSVGDGTFKLKVAATKGAASNTAIDMNSALEPAVNEFSSMNRYWDATVTKQPSTPVSVRFYYNTQDFNDLNGSYPGKSLTQNRVVIYKLTGGNPDPTTDWAGGTANNYYKSAGSPSLTTWVYSDLGNDHHQAEFLVSSFSGGGAGFTMNPLPVSFISFNAVAQKDKVVLDWSTASESNSKEFIVQRSLDGGSFENVGTRAAAGNSTSTRRYSFNDLSAMNFGGRTIFYRISERDMDGKSILSDVRKVSIPTGGNSFRLRYNPVKNEALFNYTGSERKQVVIRVIDHLGRVIITKSLRVEAGSNPIRISTGNLATGIYEVELRSNNEQHVARMMKE